MPAKGFVILTLAFHQEGKTWLGECLELGTATYGRTLKQVHAELVELVELHLEVIEKSGEREHFFKTQDIKFYSDEQLPAEVEQKLPLDDGYFFQPHRVLVGSAG